MKDKIKIQAWRLQYQDEDGEWIGEDDMPNLQTDIEDFFQDKYKCTWDK